MRQLEYWRWRYRDPRAGTIRRTDLALTEEEEAMRKYPDAQRIEGTRSFRYVDDERTGSCDTRQGMERARAERGTVKLSTASRMFKLH
jgi:hypothetical protein